jgi:hypothetical protein
MYLGNTDNETGVGSTGSNFELRGVTDGGLHTTVLKGLRSDNLLTIAGNPTAALGIAPKQYVDTRVLRAGDTMTGNFISNSSLPITTGAQVNSFEVRGSSHAAMSFHIPGAVAANFGIAGDGNFYYGGWSHGSSVWKFWSQRDFNYTPVNKAGDTITGGLNVNGPFTVYNDAAVTGAFTVGNACGINGLLTVQAKGGGHPAIYLNNTGGANVAQIGFNVGSNKFGIYNMYAPANPFEVTTSGTAMCSGYTCRSGQSGTYGNVFNFEWDSGNGGLRSWIDNAFIGIVTVTSDYRIKKDVADLGSMWDRVKALRPISYTQAEYTPEPPTPEPARMVEMPDGTMVEQQPLPPPSGPLYEEDNIPRWGFIAHELQETLLLTAATGVKDAKNAVQSINVAPVVAALTKALQEAMIKIEDLMARIEALEAK